MRVGLRVLEIYGEVGTQSPWKILPAEDQEKAEEAGDKCGQQVGDWQLEGATC